MENPLRAEKRRKLSELRALVDPFPHNFHRTATVASIKEQFGGFAAGEKDESRVFTLAGRLKARRDMGKASFLNIQDQSGNIQLYIRKTDLPEVQAKVFDLLDIGDIIGIKGFPFRTQKGELSLHVHELDILTKTLEPLPEKFHGIADVEIKYRYRHLDLIMDAESRQVFETRSRIIREIRNFLDKRGFLEVETPVLQPIYGGAAAHPFETHHRALDMKLYLKISPELYLKRLIVGGMEKVYEIAKNFRNEGIDRSHNPEFTMVEWYEAYTDYLDQMKTFESLVSHLAITITGSPRVPYQGREIDFTPPWKRLTVRQAISQYANLDVTQMSHSELLSKAREFDKDLNEKTPKGLLEMTLFEEMVEPNLWDPVFIMDHPVEISPLTKAHRSEPGLVERFEPFAAGMEIGNSYTELNDPEDQYARLKDQESQRVINEEAHPMDEDFLHAIDVGMPPTGGVGLGIERIVMLLTNRPSIRDILLFPTMKTR